MAIQKPEWFKMDPAKFLTDTMIESFSTLELGACFRLLCRQWIDGSLPDNVQVLGRLARVSPEEMESIWPSIEPFFPRIEGRRANRYMWVERECVVSELERRSKDATKAVNKRWEYERGKKSNTETGGPYTDSITDGIPVVVPVPYTGGNTGSNTARIPDVIQDQSRPDQSRPEETTSDPDGSEIKDEPELTPPDQPAVPKDWIAQFASDWEEIVKGVPNYGRIGKTAKGAVEQFGFDRARVAWRRFLADPKARQYRFASFSQDFGDYEPQLWGVNGEFTPEQLRELGIIQ